MVCSRHPTTKWAQRSDKVYITIELPDAKDVKLTLEPEGRFYFSATSGTANIRYELDLELFDRVNVDVRIQRNYLNFLEDPLKNIHLRHWFDKKHCRRAKLLLA